MKSKPAGRRPQRATRSCCAEPAGRQQSRSRTRSWAHPAPLPMSNPPRSEATAAENWRRSSGFWLGRKGATPTGVLLVRRGPEPLEATPEPRDPSPLSVDHRAREGKVPQHRHPRHNPVDSERNKRLLLDKLDEGHNNHPSDRNETTKPVANATDSVPVRPSRSP